MNTWRAITSAWLALGLAGLSLGSHAVSKGGTVVVNGVQVLTLRTGGPASRASHVASAISAARSGAPVSAKVSRRSATITLGGQALITISRAEAKAAGMSPAGLASRWTSALRTALSLPPIKVLETSLKVPQGGTRTLKIVGSKAHVANWRVVPEGRVDVRRNGGAIEIAGRQTGSVSVVFSANGFEADAVVDVLPLAAVFPQNVSAFVSGLPAQREIVRGAVETAIRTQLKHAKAASLDLEIPELWPISAGQARVVPIRVKAHGAGAFPNEGIAQVTIRNVGLGYAREEELWYSNNPENLKGPGNLMQGSLAAGKAVRLLYHHINDSPKGLYVQVEAVNTSDEVARVLMIPGDSEPDKNPVLAGIVAGERFLRRWLNASGEVVAIPPRSRMPLALRRLAPKETMSGLCSLWMLEDGPKSIELRVHAEPPTSPEANLASIVAGESPWHYTGGLPLNPNPSTAPAHFEHVYPNPFKITELTHFVGGKHGFVRIGQHPIARADQNGALDGNFGVLYRIDVNAENETDVATDLEVVFEASAGYSGALFVLNGGVLRTPLLQPKTSVRLIRMRLVPGGSKKFDLLTMPLSGSSYPATVILRPVDANAQPAVDLSRTWTYKL